MLVLTRKDGEAVAIGDDITVTIVSIQGGQVRVGIDAPHEAEVHREEVWQRINAPVVA